MAGIHQPESDVILPGGDQQSDCAGKTDARVGVGVVRLDGQVIIRCVFQLRRVVAKCQRNIRLRPVCDGGRISAGEGDDDLGAIRNSRAVI